MITNPLWVVNTRIKIQGLKCGTEKQKTAPSPRYRGIIGKNLLCPRQLNRLISKLKLRFKIFNLIQGKSVGYVTCRLKTKNFTIWQYLNRQWEILLHSNVAMIKESVKQDNHSLCCLRCIYGRKNDKKIILISYYI